MTVLTAIETLILLGAFFGLLISSELGSRGFGGIPTQ